MFPVVLSTSKISQPIVPFKPVSKAKRSLADKIRTSQIVQKPNKIQLYAVLIEQTKSAELRNHFRTCEDNPVEKYLMEKTLFTEFFSQRPDIIGKEPKLQVFIEEPKMQTVIEEPKIQIAVKEIKLEIVIEPESETPDSICRSPLNKNFASMDNYKNKMSSGKSFDNFIDKKYEAYRRKFFEKNNSAVQTNSQPAAPINKLIRFGKVVDVVDPDMTTSYINEHYDVDCKSNKVKPEDGLIRNIWNSDISKKHETDSSKSWKLTNVTNMSSETDLSASLYKTKTNNCIDNPMTFSSINITSRF